VWRGRQADTHLSHSRSGMHGKRQVRTENGARGEGVIVRPPAEQAADALVGVVEDNHSCHCTCPCVKVNRSEHAQVMASKGGACYGWQIMEVLPQDILGRRSVSRIRSRLLLCTRPPAGSCAAHCMPHAAEDVREKWESSRYSKSVWLIRILNDRFPRDLATLHRENNAAQYAETTKRRARIRARGKYHCRESGYTPYHEFGACSRAGSRESAAGKVMERRGHAIQK
jgi:hypothetical protein